MSSNRAIRWLFFDVVLPLFPILIAAVLLWLQQGSMNYIDLASGPEPFLFCTIVTATTLGGLIETAEDFKRTGLYTALAYGTIVLLLYSGSMFGVLFYLDRAGLEPFRREATANLALGSAILILVTCALGQWLFVSKLREVG